MLYILDDLKAFLDSSKTAWHAVYELSNRLALKEFIPLSEEEKWPLQHGKSYFVIRGGSLCAFSIPKAAPKKALILAAHTDSPALKIKPNPEVHKENMILLGVEVYGNPLLSSWLNRDLGIAGRVVINNAKGEVSSKLIFIEDAPFVIPQLAIHLDREVNEKGLILNKQDHLFPILGLEEEAASHLERLIRQELSFHQLLGYDLFLVPLENSRYLGSKNELIASHRIDNLASCHAAVTAMASSSKEKNSLQMTIFWDHEEVGSRSDTGAFSPFLTDLLKRIAFSLKIDEEEFLRLKSRSHAISIDMAHAFNPNYANKYEPNHQPLLGKGIVIKYNADQKYASNGETASLIMAACHKLHLFHQSFVSRSDIPCGSTIGPIMAQNLGIPTVDIGVPQLSMHSIREVMAGQDHIDMCQLLTHLLEE